MQFRAFFVTRLPLVSKNGHVRLFSELPNRVIVPTDQIDIAYSRSSGPGGQNVNKVNTKVELRFNVERATWLGEYARQRLIFLQAKRINKANELVVTSMISRSQHRNMQNALEKLQSYVDEAHQVVKERILTEKPVAAKEVRLKDKHMASVKKILRKKPRDDE